MRKKTFILLEIIISLGLLSILLGFLFNAISDGIKNEVRVEKARKILFERQRLQTRLQDIFLSVAPAHLPPIYTQKFPEERLESLIVYFDHGIDPNPAFSGPIVGRIYIDQKKNLNLSLWPLEKEKGNRPWRKELLLSNVTSFQFEFLGQKQTKESVPVTTSLAWHKRWGKKRMEVPSMIRLSVVQDKTELSFAFFLSTSDPFVTYWEEGYHS